MNQNQPATVRPTKKQRQLLDFITAFIKEHGYSPSYREIMNGLQYTSVATVALHVNNLIRRGHLAKRDHSARSIEVINQTDQPDAATDQPSKWFTDKIEAAFVAAEAQPTSQAVADLAVLVKSMQILGYQLQSQKLVERLEAIKASKLLDKA